jgi:hypothetical protein
MPNGVKKNGKTAHAQKKRMLEKAQKERTDKELSDKAEAFISALSTQVGAIDPKNQASANRAINKITQQFNSWRKNTILCDIKDYDEDSPRIDESVLRKSATLHRRFKQAGGYKTGATISQLGVIVVTNNGRHYIADKKSADAMTDKQGNIFTLDCEIPDEEWGCSLQDRITDLAILTKKLTFDPPKIGEVEDFPRDEWLIQMRETTKDSKRPYLLSVFLDTEINGRLYRLDVHNFIKRGEGHKVCLNRDYGIKNFKPFFCLSPHAGWSDTDTE